MKNLIQQIKENDQDFEFYPTTKEIIQVIYNDLVVTMKTFSSVLRDIFNISEAEKTQNFYIIIFYWIPLSVHRH